jgi:hypothetical protein
MGTQLTLEIPDDVLRRASTVASATRRDVTVVLTEALSTIFGAPGMPEQPSAPVRSLSDAEVLALADARLPEQTAHRLSELLAARAEGERDNAVDAELEGLMQIYQSLWLRQSEALAEAVRRGLRPPLEP